MSELKSFIVLYDGKFIRAYEESEADKVIAEMKAQKAQAEDDCAYWKVMAQKNAEDNVAMAKQRAEAFKIERHNKYKRCLAMARWCMARYNEWAAYYPTTTTRKMKFLDKWENRWRELAEKFKEAK